MVQILATVLGNPSVWLAMEAGKKKFMQNRMLKAAQLQNIIALDMY